jgi:hypothetical protein
VFSQGKGAADVNVFTTVSALDSGADTTKTTTSLRMVFVGSSTVLADAAVDFVQGTCSVRWSAAKQAALRGEGAGAGVGRRPLVTEV